MAWGAVNRRSSAIGKPPRIGQAMAIWPYSFKGHAEEVRNTTTSGFFLFTPMKRHTPPAKRGGARFPGEGGARESMLARQVRIGDRLQYWRAHTRRSWPNE